MKGNMIIAEGCEYSMDCYSTKLNNNVMVVGGSGAGKTTGIVEPNILQACGSYVITDPKGNLYRKYGDYLRSRGYEVMSIDLSNPDGSTRYNFMDYIRDEHDVIKIAHMIIGSGGKDCFTGHNSYFYNNAELLLASALACVKYLDDIEEIKNLDALLRYCRNNIFKQADTKTASIDKQPDDNDPWCNLSDKFLISMLGIGEETAGNILSTVGSVLGRLNTVNVQKMMTSQKHSIDFESLGLEKTALFVTVSDSDRSMDVFAEIFFTQAMQELCRLADKECENEALPVPVRFIMDDFATNCTINDFPRMISSIRSRNISVMLMLQAESQLEERYGRDAYTIISNCDTYIYMGGNDLETAKRIAERADVPFRKILYMPVGSNWIFRRGQAPINGRNYSAVTKRNPRP